MPEAAMKPDQERVKNLLTDTVTLLCKNGLTFSNKLRIEGLLGVSIDDKDVFFVHISENFHQNPPEPLPEEESAESPVFTAPESPAKNSRRSRQSPSPSQTSSPATLVKPEPEDDPDELLIVEEPKPELFDRSRMVAGQRRAQRRERSPSQGGQQHGWEESGEPPIKRHLSSEEDENGGGGYVDQGSWPDLSGVGGDFDQSQVYQQDPGGAGFDTTTPGCSTWPTTLATQHQTQDSTASYKKLPESALGAGVVRSALAEYLVNPTYRFDRRFITFRLMWAGKNIDSENVWANISDYQHTVCQHLMTLPGIEFFLSTITATVTRPAKSVNPGLGFWLRCDPSIVREYEIFTLMRSNSIGAELKIIKSGMDDSDPKTQLSNVSMAVKDFGPGLVQDKVVGAVGVDKQYMRQRLYVRETVGDTKILVRAQEALAACGFYMHMESF